MSASEQGDSEPGVSIQMTRRVVSLTESSSSSIISISNSDDRGTFYCVWWAKLYFTVFLHLLDITTDFLLAVEWLMGYQSSLKICEVLTDSIRSQLVAPAIFMLLFSTTGFLCGLVMLQREYEDVKMNNNEGTNHWKFFIAKFFKLLLEDFVTMAIVCSVYSWDFGLTSMTLGITFEVSNLAIISFGVSLLILIGHGIHLFYKLGKGAFFGDGQKQKCPVTFAICCCPSCCVIWYCGILGSSLFMIYLNQEDSTFDLESSLVMLDIADVEPECFWIRQDGSMNTNYDWTDLLDPFNYDYSEDEYNMQCTMDYNGNLNCWSLSYENCYFLKTAWDVGTCSVECGYMTVCLDNIMWKGLLE